MHSSSFSAWLAPWEDRDMAERTRQHDWVQWSDERARRVQWNETERRNHGHHIWAPGTLRGCITGEIFCIQPVHIGTGLILEDEKGQLYKPTAKLRGEPIIPGSTLKGLLRSVIEALTDSCLIVFSRSLEDAGVDTRSNKLGPCAIDRPCMACRLFGTTARGREAPSYASRLRFADAVASKGQWELTRVQLPTMWQPRRASKGRKFYYHGRMLSGQEPVEAIKAGSRLAWRIDFHNMADDELNLLLLALFGLHKFLPSEKQKTHVVAFKVGGYKPACLGSIQMISPEVWLHQDGGPTRLQPSELAARVTTGRTPPEFNEKAAHALAEIWSYPRDPKQLEQCKYGAIEGEGRRW